MEQLLTALAMLFALLMVLAAAIEAVLEMFRGVLERCGITWLKGKTSLADALSLAAEIAPTSSALLTKLAAVEATAKQSSTLIKEKAGELADLRKELEGLGDNYSDKVSATLNSLASAVSESLAANERRRIWVMKLISASLGIGFCALNDFHIFEIMAATSDAQQIDKVLSHLQEPWLNRIVGGVAAAAGSNYWHDQLDRVRALKSSFSSVRKLGTLGAN